MRPAIRLRIPDRGETIVQDFFRGDVVFANEADIRRLGYEPGQKVDLTSLWSDGIERRISGFTLLAFDIPEGQAAAYYPETNPLVPLESIGIGSHTPTSKFIAIRVHPASADRRIL